MGTLSTGVLGGRLSSQLDKFFKSRSFSVSVILLILYLTVVVVGAAGPYVGFESESGVTSGQAAAASDSSASGGSYLGFTAATPPVGGTNTFLATFSTREDFYNRFVYHVGNACDNQGCRPENLPDWADPIVTWPGDHNMACEGPTTARTIHVGHHDQLFWYCAPGNDPSKGHVMTSLNTSGYGIASFSPNQVFTNIRSLCWDINLTDLGGGKWTNVILVPESEYPRHPNTNPLRTQEGEGPYRLDYTTPGFNDDSAPGDFNVQDHDMAAGNQIWGLKNFRGSLTLFQGDNEIWSNNFSAAVTSDKAARFKHCITENANNTITISQAVPSGTTRTYTVTGQIPNGQVRVIFQDDNYDPPKRGGYDINNNTWHWDNITIE